jgi:hypothetical protein
VTQPSPLLAWCMAQREMMLKNIAELERGRIKIGEVLPSGQTVDQSQVWAHTLKLRVSELEELIAKYGVGAPE